MIQIVSKKHWVTYELEGTDMSSTNKGADTYNSKKGVLYEWKKRFGRVYSVEIISWENLIPFPSRIQRIMQTHGGLFSNSFSTCIGQQIQLYTSWSESRQHKFTDIGKSIFDLEEYCTAGYFWDTLWSKSRQHKFTNIDISIFLLERSSPTAKIL